MNDTNELTFTITFHGPFHVSTGETSFGYDDTIDTDALLPGSSLKGVMRYAAHTLAIPQPLIEAVFGRGGGAASPWSWSDAEFTEAQVFGAARIKIAESGTTEVGFLRTSQEVSSPEATFTVRQRASAPDDHRLVLRAAARAVISLGGGRRRGSGWVTIGEPSESTWSDKDTEKLLALGARP